MKRYKDWNCNLMEFLKIDDLVDEEFVDYFIEVLPPATMNSQCIQIGEPYSQMEDICKKIWRQTFPTLKKTPEGWRYAGNCFMGETCLPNSQVYSDINFSECVECCEYKHRSDMVAIDGYLYCKSCSENIESEFENAKNKN